MHNYDSDAHFRYCSVAYTACFMNAYQTMFSADACCSQSTTSGFAPWHIQTTKGDRLLQLHYCGTQALQKASESCVSTTLSRIGTWRLQGILETESLSYNEQAKTHNKFLRSLQSDKTNAGRRMQLWVLKSVCSGCLA